MQLPDHQQQLRWLLKDKYQLQSLELERFLQQRELWSPEMRKDEERLRSGEPLAYVIGWTPFLGCQIDLSYKPLIPRPETEFWVESLITEKRTHWSVHQTYRVLDLCCGSGCIGVALLHHLPQVECDFIDIDPQAVAQTNHNLVLNRIEPTRARVLVSNLFSHLNPSETYDLIVSNPPYLNPDDETPPELQYEPAQALFAPEAGLSLIGKIVMSARQWIKLGGEVVIEFGKGQEREIDSLARQAGWEKVIFSPDQFGVTRTVKLS